MLRPRLSKDSGPAALRPPLPVGRIPLQKAKATPREGGREGGGTPFPPLPRPWANRPCPGCVGPGSTRPWANRSCAGSKGAVGGPRRRRQPGGRRHPGRHRLGGRSSSRRRRQQQPQTTAAAARHRRQQHPQTTAAAARRLLSHKARRHKTMLPLRRYVQHTRRKCNG